MFINQTFSSEKKDTNDNYRLITELSEQKEINRSTSEKFGNAVVKYEKIKREGLLFGNLGGWLFTIGGVIKLSWFSETFIGSFGVPCLIVGGGMVLHHLYQLLPVAINRERVFNALEKTQLLSDKIPIAYKNESEERMRKRCIEANSYESLCLYYDGVTASRLGLLVFIGGMIYSYVNSTIGVPILIGGILFIAYGGVCLYKVKRKCNLKCVK